ncbi:MAG TPA: redox-sensing transcriptional repressor Rex [Acidimicrobiia bacterium]|nr:redox-sensing transcriptional repressor Rex [Acidimicrobiia bacterium]
MTDRIPDATVRRLPKYLQFLEDIAPTRDTVGSEDIATAAGGSAVQVRKDLSHVRYSGTRGVGYDVPLLTSAIRRALGLERTRRVALVGAGNLGTALAGYGGFAATGFDISAVYDKSPQRIGAMVGGMPVRDIGRLVADALAAPYEIGVIATPVSAAQSVTDRMVEARIRAILNFTGVNVRVPPEVVVRNVDLATEFRILSYYLAR